MLKNDNGNYGNYGNNLNKRVYVDGVFDLFHLGHVNFLKQAKSLGTELLIGVVTDTDAASYKRKPIIPYEFRRQMIKEFAIACDVIPATLYLTKEFIDQHKIDLVVHADDDEQADFFQVTRQLGIMKYIPYTSNISTTDIIEWVKKSK